MVGVGCSGVSIGTPGRGDVVGTGVSPRPVCFPLAFGGFLLWIHAADEIFAVLVRGRTRIYSSEPLV